MERAMEIEPKSEAWEGVRESRLLAQPEKQDE
jgi:hypothetical protein